MAKFDLSAIFGDAAPQPSAEIQRIDVDRLRASEKNFYDVSNVGDLMDSIALHGILDPVTVTPLEDGYRIISGHRRTAAIRKLVTEEGREDLRLVPCLVRQPQSEAMEELMLIFANSTTRVLTDAEKAAQAARVTELFYQLKNEGVPFPGRMQDHVAKACEISTSKLERLNTIRKKLCPELAEQWESGKLSEQAAYAMAHVSPELQARVAMIFPRNRPIEGAAAVALQKRAASGIKWEPTISCPDGLPCTHANGFLRRDAKEQYVSSACDGSTCCITCFANTRTYNQCKYACSKAVAARKEASAEAEAARKKANAQAKRDREEAAQKNAKRLLPVVDSAGLDESDRIKWGRWETVMVKDLRAISAGDFENLPPRSHGAFSLKEAPLETALQLGCSPAWMLELTDDPWPAAAVPNLGTWRTDTDYTDGTIVAAYELQPGTAPFLRVTTREKVLDAELEPICWYPLPPVPEDRKGAT